MLGLGLDTTGQLVQRVSSSADIIIVGLEQLMRLLDERRPLVKDRPYLVGQGRNLLDINQLFQFSAGLVEPPTEFGKLPGGIQAFFALLKLLTAALLIGLLKEGINVLQDRRQIFGRVVGRQGLEEGIVVGADLLAVTIQRQTALVQGRNLFFQLGSSAGNSFQFKSQFVGLVVLGRRADTEIGGKAGRLLLKLLEPFLQRFETAESGHPFCLQGINQGRQCLIP